MIGVCKENEGYLLTQKRVKEGHDRKTTHVAISKGKSYNVYGIILYEENVDYLIYDDNSSPNWYSADLFDVIDAQLPQNWYYRFYGYQEYGLSAIWGYYELVLVENHFDGLAERVEEDIRIFLRRKRKIDEFIKSQNKLSNDWRLQDQEEYLVGRKLTWKKWVRSKQSWDHDNCKFCWAKFSDIEESNDLGEGYTTEDNHYWICSTCFEDFKEMFKWTVDK